MAPYLKLAGHILYRYLDREALARRFAETHQENHKHNTREFWQGAASNLRPNVMKDVPEYPPPILLWQGDVWLTRDRWAFWKQRLVWISQQIEPNLSQSTRDEALKLVGVMEEIEARVA